MPVQGVLGAAPRWVDQVRLDTSGEGEVCSIPQPVDQSVAALIPKDVKLLAADEQRLKDALQTLQQAQGRVYYDAPQDAADRTAYYGDIAKSSLTPGQMYDSLHALVEKTHTTKLDYDPSSNLYPWVDLHPDGKLHSVYSGVDMDPSEAIRADVTNGALRREALQNAVSVASSMGGGADAKARTAAIFAALPFNCEHVVPQSWFDKKSPMRGDLHHLFACDPGCNSMRGNLTYSEQPGEAGTTCGKLSSGKNSFEPAAGKGAVARATLYFILRYPGMIGDQASEYSVKDLQTLQEWSRQNPVTEWERHRNAEIAKKQGNRNPLIDFPEWVDRIDFSKGIGKS